MKNLRKGVNTICTHEGEIVDQQFGGSVSPIFVSTSYEYIDKQVTLQTKSLCVRKYLHWNARNLLWFLGQEWQL